MNKEEFLKVLKESLTMSLEKDAINEQLDYYDKYISDEIKKGRNEKEVLDELGDPRLIAKTIKTVNKTDSFSNSVQTDSYDSSDNNSYNRYNNSYTNSSNNNIYKSYTNSTGIIGCTITLLILFIIVYSALRMLGYIAYGVGSLALSGPIGLLFVLILIYILFFSGRR